MATKRMPKGPVELKLDVSPANKKELVSSIFTYYTHNEDDDTFAVKMYELPATREKGSIKIVNLEHLPLDINGHVVLSQDDELIKYLDHHSKLIRTDIYSSNHECINEIPIYRTSIEEMRSFFYGVADKADYVIVPGILLELLPSFGIGQNIKHKFISPVHCWIGCYPNTDKWVVPSFRGLPKGM